MNNLNTDSRTGSMRSLLEDSGPILDPAETTNNTNNEAMKYQRKSIPIKSTAYISINPSEKPVEDIVLLPGTEQFVRWSGMEASPNINNPVPNPGGYYSNYDSHYERVVNRKSNRKHHSSHHGSHHHRSSKHDPENRPSKVLSKHQPGESVRQSYPIYESQGNPRNVISSLEINVPDLVPTEVLTSPSGDFTEEVFSNKPENAHSDTNIFFPQFEGVSNRNSKHFAPKSKKLVPGEIFTPNSRRRECKPYLLKKVRGSSMQSIPSASYCSNCQLTTCPNCQHVIQTPIRSASYEFFGSMSQTPRTQSYHQIQPHINNPPSLRSKSNLVLSSPGFRLRHRHSSLMDLDRRSYASLHPDNSQDLSLVEYRDLLRNVDFLEIEYLVPEDMDIRSQLSNEKLHVITKLAKQVMAKSRTEDDMAKIMKEGLDRHLDPSWHVIVGADSYGSNLASLPGALANFRIDKWAFLVWQT